MAVYLPTAVNRDMIPITLNPPNEVVITQESPSSPPNVKEQEKRVRREIANSNERRRMQSINAGFQSLRNLLPIPDGEKLSKAAILQQTTNLIFRLEQEKTQLLNQISGLKRAIRKGGEGADPDSPSQKKRKRNDSLMDEGIGSPGGLEETNNMEEVQKSVLELRSQLDRERQYRKALEEKNRLLEAKFYPEKIKELTKQIQREEPQKPKTVPDQNHQQLGTLLSEKDHRLVTVGTLPAPDHTQMGSIRSILSEGHQQQLQNVRNILSQDQQLEVQNALAVAALSGYAGADDCTATTAALHQNALAAAALGGYARAEDCTTTAAIRRNLETIYKAIRHVEGATPVQTPTPTPTPEDVGEEPEGSIRVIRQVEEAGLDDVAGIKVQLVHPLHMLTTRPTSISVT